MQMLIKLQFIFKIGEKDNFDYTMIAYDGGLKL